jgi:hypothetical protein
MIHKTGVSRREMKNSQEINLVEGTMANVPKFIDWSAQSILMSIPRTGHTVLVIEAQIGGFNISKVFMDGGSGLNLIFASAVKAMGIAADML